MSTAGLVTSEWTKIRSVRSTLWSLLAFVVVAIGFSTLVASVISNNWDNPGRHPEHATLLTDPTSVIFGAGFGIGQLAICVLGVIVISSEYSTGAIRSSLLAVPRRIPMLAAKAGVFAVIDAVVSAITVFAVFFISTAILRSHVNVTLSQPGVTRAVLGGILYLTVLGLFALAVGGLLAALADQLAGDRGQVAVDVVGDRARDQRDQRGDDQDQRDYRGDGAGGVPDEPADGQREQAEHGEVQDPAEDRAGNARLGQRDRHVAAQDRGADEEHSEHRDRADHRVEHGEHARLGRQHGYPARSAPRC